MRAVDDNVVAPDGNHGLLRVESLRANGVECFVERTNVVFDAVLPSVALTAGAVREGADVLVIKFLRPAALDTERTMPRVKVLGDDVESFRRDEPQRIDDAHADARRDGQNLQREQMRVEPLQRAGDFLFGQEARFRTCGKRR